MEGKALNTLRELAKSMGLDNNFFPLTSGYLNDYLLHPENYKDIDKNHTVKITENGLNYLKELKKRKITEEEGAHYVGTILSLLEEKGEIKVSEILKELKYSFEYHVLHSLSRMACKGRESDCPYVTRYKCLRLSQPLIELRK